MITNNLMRIVTAFSCCIYLLYGVGCQSNREKKLQEQVDSLHTIIQQNDVLDSMSFSGKVIDDSIANKTDDYHHPLLKSPDELKKELFKHPELIPLKSVLGGNMFFTKAKVLNKKWIYAEYEDGHILGNAVFEYNYEKDGTVSFKLVNETHND